MLSQESKQWEKAPQEAVGGGGGHQVDLDEEDDLGKAPQEAAASVSVVCPPLHRRRGYNGQGGGRWRREGGAG